MMSADRWPTSGNDYRLSLVATDAVWIGAVKRAAFRPQNRPPHDPAKWRVDYYTQVVDVPLPATDSRQFLLLEVNREGVVPTARWLFRRRPLATQWRAGILLSRSSSEFYPQELGSVCALLREAGASHIVTNVWDLAPLISWGEQFLVARKEGIFPRLPLPISAEGWQGAGRRV